MNRMLIFAVVLGVGAPLASSVSAAEGADEQMRTSALAVLFAGSEQEEGSVRVKATDLLLKHNRFDELNHLEQAFEPGAGDALTVDRIGLCRVLAQLPGLDADRKKAYLEVIRAALDATDELVRREALMAVAVLGDEDSREQVASMAAQEDATSRVYAQWALFATSVKDEQRHQAEAALAEQMRAEQPQTRRAAAFALSQLSDLQDSTTGAIVAAAEREPIDSPAKPYLVMCRFIHESDEAARATVAEAIRQIANSGPT